MSEYDNLIAVIGSILDEHNSAAGDGNGVDKKVFFERLVQSGGIMVAALKEANAEDIQGCGVPKLLAKRVVTAICEATTPQESERPARRITVNTASDASDEDLVKSYDPYKPTSPAAAELKARSQGQPFVVFDPNSGGVHRKVTLELLLELKAGHSPREHYVVGGLPQSVYRVGEQPQQKADEHPLKQGVALRPDGTDSFGLKWDAAGLTLVKRQLLRLAIESGELRVVETVDGYSEVHDRACELNEEALHQRYPKASRRFQELRESNQLPTLRVPIGASSCGGRANDPFHGGGHRRY